MRSCLYECRVMHHRFKPKEHRFDYRIFLFALDLDELEALDRRSRWFAVNRRGVYSLRESDYLPTGTAATLKERVVRHAGAHGVDLAGGRILLATLPRVLGYAFNPVSFYFCFDREGRPAAAIAEVTNTFREVKPYFLRPGADGRFRGRQPKQFYVSPYSDVDVAFDFSLASPDDRFAVRIDDYTGGERTLASALSGPRREFTDARLAGWLVKYPLLTLRVIALIHWHALLLWLKRVPWFAKAARAADQQGLLHPHSSPTDARPDPAGARCPSAP